MGPMNIGIDLNSVERQIKHTLNPRQIMSSALPVTVNLRLVLIQFTTFQTEGLRSLNCCLRSIRNALEQFKYPRAWKNKGGMTF